MELRDYQTRAINQAVAALKTGDNPVVCMSTGGGKSIVAISVAQQFGKPAIVVAHSVTLQEQWFGRYGLKAFNILTLKNVQLPDDTLIIVDEMHHYSNNVYADILRQLPNPKLGLSATPIRRLSEQGFEEVFDTLVNSVTFSELLANEHLSDFEYNIRTQDGWHKVGPSGSVEARKIAAANAEWAQSNLKAATVKQTIIEILRDPKAKLLVFAQSTELAKSLASDFNGNATIADNEFYPIGSVVYDTPADLRKQSLKDFEAGKIRLLTTKAALLEGVDLPTANALLLARPMTSTVAFYQAIGRVLRPLDGKVAQVYDMANAVAAIGFPADPRVWTLRPADEALEQCPECLADGFAGLCVECGYILRPARGKGTQLPICPICGKPVRGESCKQCSVGYLVVPGVADNVTMIVIGGHTYNLIDGSWVTDNKYFSISIRPGAITVSIFRIIGRKPAAFAHTNVVTFKTIAEAVRALTA